MQAPESSLSGLLANVAEYIRRSCNTDITHEDISAHLLAGRPLSTVTPQLAAIGALPANARQACLKAANDLRDACENSLRKALKAPGGITQKEVKIINDVLSASEARQTLKSPKYLLSNVSCVDSSTATLRHHVKGKKTAFNHEYTPFLEKYFEYNAYPSAPDRAVLAKKSMMTTRQIEVWFQNHRNRAKKDGKTLRRLTDNRLPTELSLKSLEDRMPYLTIPAHERKALTSLRPAVEDSSDADAEDKPPIMTARKYSSPDLLSPPRPPHAFPTMYSPRSGNHPFTTLTNNFIFPPPIWPRKCVTSRRNCSNPINIDDLVTQFSQKLHLRAPMSKGECFERTRSWYTARVTSLPPAPHPALLRSCMTSLTAPLCSLSIHRSAIACCDSRSSTSTSLPTAIVPNGIRKISRLPERTPIVIARHRNADEDVEDTSPHAFRVSASDSEYKFTRRSSSPNSSSSSSSSEPPTPLQSSTSLPEVVCSSSRLDIRYIQNSFDFERDTCSNIGDWQTSSHKDALPKHSSLSPWLRHTLCSPI
ncbi:hypothetical protein E4T56_gene6766 [Termitomyces sp. T112]|nr:hypothetical protein E4T56_gene6766 [Termitomyces sp. T112]